MIDRDGANGTDPGTLDYASRSSTTRRLSKLAVTSLIVSLLASPFVAGPFLVFNAPEGLSYYVPVGYTVLVLAIAGTALPVIALVRIGRSNRTLSGGGLAVAGVIISVCWWAVILFFLSFRGP